MHGKLYLILKNNKSCYLRDNSPLQRSNEFNLVESLKTNDTFSKKK